MALQIIIIILLIGIGLVVFRGLERINKSTTRNGNILKGLLSDDYVDKVTAVYLLLKSNRRINRKNLIAMIARTKNKERRKEHDSRL